MVVDNGAVWWIFSCGFFLWNGCVCISTPSHTPGLLWFVKDHGLSAQRRTDLPQRCDVIENPEASSVCTHYDVIVLDHQITDRRSGHIQTQRLPVFPIVKRYIHGAFRTCIQQALANRIFPNGIDRIIRQALHNFFPCFSTVMCFVNMRFHVIEPDPVNGSISCVHIKMTGFHQGYLTPGSDG